MKKEGGKSRKNKIKGRKKKQKGATKKRRGRKTIKMKTDKKKRKKTLNGEK